MHQRCVLYIIIQSFPPFSAVKYMSITNFQKVELFPQNYLLDLLAPYHKKPALCNIKSLIFSEIFV